MTKQLLTICILICTLSLHVFARDPLICEKGCKDGYYINEDCSCSEARFCTMEACPNFGEVKDFRNCSCTPKDDILPYEPIICKSIKCKPGYKIDKNCKCQLESTSPGDFPEFPEFPEFPDFPGFPKKCQIKSCNRHFRFDKKSCSCKKWKGGTCRKGCPRGMRIYALPKKINCNCVKIIKCPITSCIGSSKLYNCKCVPNDFPIPPKCGIKSCKNMFELFRPKCKCRRESLPSCKKGCPRGMMIKPGTCKCVKRPRCSIKKCHKGYRLNRRKCQCRKRRRRRMANSN